MDVPDRRWVTHRSGAAEFTTPRRRPRACFDQNQIIADRVERAASYAIAAFARGNRRTRADTPRDVKTITRAARILFRGLGIDRTRSEVLFSQFVADVSVNGASVEGFLELNKTMMHLFETASSLKMAVDLMRKEPQGDVVAACAVCESLCGDPTLASLMVVMLESYMEKCDASDGTVDDASANPASLLRMLVGGVEGRSPHLAAAVFHQVMMGQLPAVMKTRGARVKVEDVDAGEALDERFAKAVELTPAFAGASPTSTITDMDTDDSYMEASSSSSSSSSSEDDDDEVLIVGETRAPTPCPADARVKMMPWWEQTSTLGLVIKKVLPDGNCFFHSISHGLNSLRGTTGTSAATTWRDVREPLVHKLKNWKSNYKGDVSNLYNLLLNGGEGREYLHQGKLRRAKVEKRFRAYLKTMQKDATPYVGSSKWKRYWATDAEMVAFASFEGIAVVCLEVSDDVSATSQSPWYLAVPKSKPSEADGSVAELGRYLSNGRYSSCGRRVVWQCSKTKMRYVLESTFDDEKRDNITIAPHAFHAVVVKHYPGHFEALVSAHNQPRQTYFVRAIHPSDGFLRYPEYDSFEWWHDA